MNDTEDSQEDTNSSGEDCRTGPGRPVTDGNLSTVPVDRRVRIAALEAQVDKLEQERARLEADQSQLETDCERLERDVRTLRSRVSQLEAKCEALETLVEYKDQQRQQVIDIYERRLAAKDRQLQRRRTHEQITLRRRVWQAWRGMPRLIHRPVAAAAGTIRDGGRLVRETVGRFRSKPGQ